MKPMVQKARKTGLKIDIKIFYASFFIRSVNKKAPGIGAFLLSSHHSYAITINRVSELSV
jgi:hypothetical protein